jgi:CRP/FNR family transcriptional regulator
LPADLIASDLERFEQIIIRRRVASDGFLYRANEPFRSLFAIRFGHFKTFQINTSGSPQITGFQMAGELLGMDAINVGRNHCSAVALEDAEVCEIPFPKLEGLFGKFPALQHDFHRMMSREITRKLNAMLLLGNMRADRRFAVFLLNLGSRYATLGYSSTNFLLRMSREEISNYLGLTIESGSRALSKLRNKGWLRVDHRNLEILDATRLEDLAAGKSLGEHEIRRPAMPDSGLAKNHRGSFETSLHHLFFQAKSSSTFKRVSTPITANIPAAIE